MLLLGGCGGDSRESQARATVESYFSALSERDFAAACGELTTSFRRDLVSYAARAYPDLESRECPAIAARISAANGELTALQRRVSVRRIDVDGASATAQLGPGQRAELVLVDGAWQIDRLDFGGAAG